MRETLERLLKEAEKAHAKTGLASSDWPSFYAAYITPRLLQWVNWQHSLDNEHNKLGQGAS